MAHSSIMANPIIQATLASYLKPIINAEPDNAFPGGLNFQKTKNLEMVIMISKNKTTEKIQRNSLGILCKNNMEIILLAYKISLIIFGCCLFNRHLTVDETIIVIRPAFI